MSNGKPLSNSITVCELSKMEILANFLAKYPVFFDTIGSYVIIFLIIAILLFDWFVLRKLKSKRLKWTMRIMLMVINFPLCSTLFMIHFPLRPMISELAKVERLIGQPVPDFSFLSVRDSVVYRISDFKNDVIIINYWATYCGPCIEELPTLKAIEESFGSKVKVIAITDEEPQRVNTFLMRVEAPVHIGLSKNSFLKMNGFLPVTVICKKGVITHYIFGRQTYDFFKTMIE